MKISLTPSLAALAAALASTAAAAEPLASPDQSSVLKPAGEAGSPDPAAAKATSGQDQPATAPANDQASAAPEAQGGIGDIIVTAQRTSTSLQRTPISIQTYTRDEIVSRGLTDISGLARADASVNITLSTGQPIIAVRGVSSQNSTEVGDPAVSVASDGIFTNRPFGIFSGLYDVDRIEVLRGPQGTLFGRNSTGGTLNVITARATSTNEAQVIAEVGNYSLIGSQGFANFVVTDGLDARISYDVRSRDGYRSNPPQRQRGDDEDLKSVRFQIAFKPSSNLSGWLLAQYSMQGGVGPVNEIIPFRYQGATGEPVHTFPVLSDGKTYPSLTPFVQDIKHWEIRGGLTYDIGGGITINYLGGYDSIRYLRRQAINPQYGGVGNGPLPVPAVYVNYQTPKTINQELRLASNPNGAFTWQVGAYYFRESSMVDAYTEYNSGSNIAQKGVSFVYPSILSTSKAVFAQGTYSLTDTLKFTAGARYTWDNKSRTGVFSIYPGNTGLPFVINIDQPASAKSSKPTYTVGLDYQATPVNMFYAKFSTGYKSGGFNDATSTYGPETVNSYEIGTKNSFFERHLQVNLSGFRMDYQNQQVTQYVTGATSSGSQTVNAGKSRIWGAELNLIAQSDTLGKLTLSTNYTHARYLQFISSAGWATTVNLNLAGNRLPLAPTWSASGQYELPIKLSSGGTITPRVAIKAQTAQYFGANNFPDQRQGGYALVDLGLDYASPGGTWSLQAFVRNVGDRKVLANAEEFYLFNNYSIYYQPPRTYGARLIVNFR